MRIYVIAVGTKISAWVKEGYQDYAKRMPVHCALELIEVPASKRTRSVDIKRALNGEGERLLAAVPPGCRRIALERTGRSIDTLALADHFRFWMQQGLNPAFLIGGPEGLAESCVNAAEECWSLSSMTFAHPLVRVLLAEQCYRAWSLVAGLPYHRASS
jgi:23S rRNA (pseudouridine1915-N3)-methyltransferase